MKSTLAVLFDLEDTLVQTPMSNPAFLIQFRQKTKQQLIALGIPSALLKGVNRASIMRNVASVYVEKELSHSNAVKFKLEFNNFLEYYEMFCATQSTVFPETVSTLVNLRKITRIGLVTNTSQKAVDRVFLLHDLKPFFDVVITKEKVDRLKPDPEGILLALRSLKSSNFIMVGDLSLDMLAAKRANGKTVFVNRASRHADLAHTFQDLSGESNEPFNAHDNLVDYIVESLAEVPPIAEREYKKINSKSKKP
jgi:HAD superfamily hydrolase (TIGR01549 family)